MQSHEAETVFLINGADRTLVEVYTCDEMTLTRLRALAARPYELGAVERTSLRGMLAAALGNPYLLPNASVRIGRPGEPPVTRP